MVAIDKTTYADAFLEKREGESELGYHRRLLSAKLIDKTLDLDYATLSPYLYGQELSSDVARRMAYGSMRTLKLVDAEKESGERTEKKSEIDDRIMELRKERQKLQDQRTAFSKLIRERSRQEELNEIIISTIERADCLPRLEYVPAEIPDSDNDLLVTLSDIHYGAVVDNRWRVYNSDICRDMFCSYIDRILRAARTHGSENCYVVSAGDLISGNIHYSIAVTNKENVIEQITGVSELIAEFLATLSRFFKTVTFISVPGNHSRLTPEKDEALLSERLDDLVEWYLRARLQNFEKVVIDGGHRIDPTMSLFDIRGKTYCCVHGDYDGSDGKMQSLQTLAGTPLYAVLSGHLHHNATDEVQGIKTMMSGSFLGMDDYCVRKRIYGKPEQMISVCGDDGIICHYDIEFESKGKNGR